MVSIGQQYERFDYFAKDPVHTVESGQFLGGAAKELGFSQMNADTLEKLQKGQDSTGKQVVELSKQGEHNAGKDITFSIDKSFSMFRYSAEAPEWFKAAHDASMNKAAETVLKIAVDKGLITYRNTIDGKQVHTAIKDINQLAAHTFLHSTSRANDPHSHAHVAVFNLAKVGDEFKAIKFDGLYTKDARAMTEQFARNSYMQEMQKLTGIDLQKFTERNKTTGETQFKGFDKETIQKYSSRAEQINDILKENDIKKTGKSAAIANKATRPDKDLSFSKEELQEKLKPESQKLENLRNDLDLSRQISGGVPLEKVDTKVDIKTAVTAQIEALSKNEVYNDLNSLYKEVAKENLNFSYKDIKTEIESRQEISFRTNITKDGFEIKQFATNENIKAEQFVQSFIKDGKGKSFSVRDIEKDLKSFEKKAGFKLSDEQRAAIKTINSNDQVSIVQGFAGTGKTTLFSAVHEVMKSGGVNVVGLSNTGAAALILQKETGIKSQTLKSLIVSKSTNKDNTGHTLFVLDETSQGGVKDVEAAIKTIQGAGYTNFKIALSGDTKQIQSIAAGNVLKNASRTNVEQTVLKDIRRQKNPELKNIILNYYNKLENPTKDGKIEVKTVINELKDKGFIKAVESGSELKTAVGIYREQEKKGTTVLLTQTRADMKAANSLIRAEKLKSGELGRAFKIDTFEKVNMKETDRRRSENYEKGGIVSWRSGQYHEITNTNHDKNTIDVKSINNIVLGKNAKLSGDNKIVITGKDGAEKLYELKSIQSKVATFYGNEKTINLSDLKDKNIDTLQKYNSKDLEIRKGDKVIFTQNIKNINPEKETIKFNKTNNSKVYETLQKFNINGFRATDFYKTIKVFNKATDWIGIQFNNARVDKAMAQAIAKGEKFNNWEFNGNKGITVVHAQEIKNNMTATFLGKSGDNYNFKIDGTGEKLTLNSKDEKGQEALAVLQHGYALTVDRSQGGTWDRAVSIGNSNMSAEQNLVSITRAKEDTQIVVSDKDLERKEDKETGKVQDSSLDRAFANTTEKTTSITDERTQDKEQSRDRDNEQSRDKDNEQSISGRQNDNEQSISGRQNDNEQSRDTEKEQEIEFSR